MPQLHELIAVEADIKNTAVKILAETQHTFAQKQAHFQGLIKTYRPFNEADKDRPGNEIKPMVTTVRAKLDYTLPYIVRQLDVIYQKEKTNSKAVADIVFEDEDGNVNTIAAAVPVTTLVQYEKVLWRGCRGSEEKEPLLHRLGQVQGDWRGLNHTSHNRFREEIPGVGFF
jgi:hypothetical protein